MDLILLDATPKTPKVAFDQENGTLEIKGTSIHENADKFYGPIHVHVQAYAKAPRPTTQIVIELDYFNSSSAKYLLEMLRQFEDLHVSGRSRVALEWRHASDDLDMEEAGEDFSSLLEFPVKIVSF